MNSDYADRSRHYLLTAAFCSVALALRGLIANDAFWLDEIWSYYLTLLMESAWDAFAVLRIDNNHLLNTLTTYWLGEQPNWAIYRLPAVLSGVATVALMGMAARLTGAIPWLAMLLATVSLPLIQYSAEARGYSSAALFGLAAWYLYFAHLERAPASKWHIAFWAVCALGLLSHLTFIFVLAALGLTWLSSCFSNQQDISDYIRKGLIAFAPPLAFLVWIYLYFYGQTSAGGAEPSLRLAPNLLELGRFSMGAPRNTVLAVLASGLMVLLMVYGICCLKPKQQVYFGLVTCLIPGLLLTVYQPGFFYPRYLLICLPFAYLLIARGLSAAIGRKGAPRILATVILLTIVGGSSVQYLELAKWGKGDYPRAINDLFTDAATEQFSVGSDFDFRNKALLDFYTRYRSDAARMVYVNEAYEKDTPTDYFFVHNQEPGHKPDTVLLLPSGAYRLIHQYPYFGLSGWNWYLYRHDD